MTIAVCFNCGEIKWGAFNACQKCRARPTTDDELTTSLLFTDHYYDQETLARVSEDIRNGVKFNIDDATRSQLAPAIHEFRRTIGLHLSARSPTHHDNNQWKRLSRVRSVLYNVSAFVLYAVICELVTTVSFMILTAMQGNYTNVFDFILQGKYVGIHPLLWSIGQLIFAALAGNSAALTVCDRLRKQYSKKFIAYGIFILIGVGGATESVTILVDGYNVRTIYFLTNAMVAIVFAWRYLWNGRAQCD